MEGRKYPCRGSPRRFHRRHVVDRIGGRGNVVPADTGPKACDRLRRILRPRAGAWSLTSATKRNPRLCSVRMKTWSLPLSPSARRAALMRLLKAASDTMRPCQMVSINSSLLTMRSRLRTRWTSRSKTCGSTRTASPARRSSCWSRSISKSVKLVF